MNDTLILMLLMTLVIDSHKDGWLFGMIKVLTIVSVAALLDYYIGE